MKRNSLTLLILITACLQMLNCDGGSSDSSLAALLLNQGTTSTIDTTCGMTSDGSIYAAAGEITLTGSAQPLNFEATGTRFTAIIFINSVVNGTQVTINTPELFFGTQLRENGEYTDTSCPIDLNSEDGATYFSSGGGSGTHTGTINFNGGPSSNIALQLKYDNFVLTQPITIQRTAN